MNVYRAHRKGSPWVSGVAGPAEDEEQAIYISARMMGCPPSMVEVELLGDVDVPRGGPETTLGELEAARALIGALVVQAQLDEQELDTLTVEGLPGYL